MPSNAVMVFPSHVSEPEAASVQVHQARLLLEMESPGADLAKDAPEGLLSAAQHVWTESAKQVTISDFHRDVSATLHAMTIECGPPLWKASHHPSPHANAYSDLLLPEECQVALECHISCCPHLKMRFPSMCFIILVRAPCPRVMVAWDAKRDECEGCSSGDCLSRHIWLIEMCREGQYNGCAGSGFELKSPHHSPHAHFLGSINSNS